MCSRNEGAIEDFRLCYQLGCCLCGQCDNSQSVYLEGQGMAAEKHRPLIGELLRI